MKNNQPFLRSAGLKILEAGLFFTAVLPGSVFAQLAAPTNTTGTPNDLITGTDSVFSKIANVMLLVLGAVAVIMLIIGGFRYVISGGDSSAIESAKNTILYAIIGIVVAFLAYAAVNFVIGGLTT